jgi:hypothetical protein
MLSKSRLKSSAGALVVGNAPPEAIAWGRNEAGVPKSSVWPEEEEGLGISEGMLVLGTGLGSEPHESEVPGRVKNCVPYGCGS